MKSLALILASFSAVAASPPPTPTIKVDQVGYGTGMPKVALVVSETLATDFTVRRAEDGAVVFQGQIAVPVPDLESGDRVQAVDFTGLDERGRFYLEVPGVGRSWEFAIGPNVFSRVFYLGMRAFYGQRCGTAVDLGAEFPGYAYAACHLEGAWHASSGKSGPREQTGGWHDAGDYGRYVVNSGITTGTLLWAWELYGARIQRVGLQLPESGKGAPDFLSEVRWNLDWMLSMQDEDGGVWHKQTSEKFADFVMPEKDTLPSQVIGTGQQPFKSSCATADFAAVMAISARVYRPFDAAYSQRCLRAARQAWGWLEQHPDVTFKNPAGVVTGEYGDERCGDERLWASAELWRTTGEEPYHRFFLAHQGEHRKTLRAVGPPDWANVAPFGLWTYALGNGKNAAVAEGIRKEALAAADQIVERSARNGYRISMVAGDYVWGSNGMVANYAVQLLVANALRRDPRYVRTAQENLHYLLGRNAFSLSWVTQVGDNPYQHPHHRPSGADSQPKPWPGLLSGGPNQNRLDPAQSRLPELPPARMYVDDEASYATNEVAINWNAPLVFILASTLPEK